MRKHKLRTWLPTVALCLGSLGLPLPLLAQTSRVAPEVLPAPAASSSFTDLKALVETPSAPMIRDALHHLLAHDLVGAEALLKSRTEPEAFLLRARVARQAGSYVAARTFLQNAQKQPILQTLVDLELGQVAWAEHDPNTTVTHLLPVFEKGGALANAAMPALIPALAQADPDLFMTMVTQFQIANQKLNDVDLASQIFAGQAQAQQHLGQAQAALATRIEQFIQTPVSLQTPQQPPQGATLSQAQWLLHIENLLAAHRSNRVFEALSLFETQYPNSVLDKTPEYMCRKHMAQAIAARKLHRYGQAEGLFAWVIEHCATDDDLVRRASYLEAKVISIRDGLRAISHIEAFAHKYPNHSMTDDVLFWAGDMYQRRNKDAQALNYYQRIDSLPKLDDQCSDARWRMAWIAYRRGSLDVARERLQHILQPDGCVIDTRAKSRALYWLGRIEESQSHVELAKQTYQQLLQTAPLNFYAQQGLPRLLNLLTQEEKQRLLQTLQPPSGPTSVVLCHDGLMQQASFQMGLQFLSLGLDADAADQFRVVALPLRLPETHKLANPNQQTTSSCPSQDAGLLLALLLSRSGAQKDAYQTLTRNFSDVLERFPRSEDMPIYKAAYPLAFRKIIATAEEESALPEYFLQALSRSESAFDPQAVSWAEAYGLTQLLVSSAQTAGRYLSPKVHIKTGEELFDPVLSARLGAALVASQARRLSSNLGFALAAYNAGDETANTWQKKYKNQEFAVFSEEVSIQETRHYVQRVLSVFGVYRWLYGQKPPLLMYENDVVQKRPTLERK